MNFRLTPLNGATVQAAGEDRRVKVTLESQDPSANRLTAVLTLLGSDVVTVTLICPLDRATPEWILEQLRKADLRDGGTYSLTGS